MQTPMTSSNGTLTFQRPQSLSGSEVLGKIILCLILVSGWIPAIANGAGPNREKNEVSIPYEVTGTLSELDLASGRGMIRTDLGKPIYLETKKPDLFKSLSVGDRVTIQLNEDGQVDKIMGTPVPELGITGHPLPDK